MSQLTPYTQQEIDKLGNAIIFLIEKIGGKDGQLSKTKLIKLIYLIEEESVRRFGLPFFNLPFEVWKLGPVAPELYVELENLSRLGVYLECEEKCNHRYYEPKLPFNDDEFSNKEIELLQGIVDKYRDYNSTQLIAVTHAENTPWRNAAIDFGVLGYLENGLMETTHIEIDLAKLLESQPGKLARYLDQIEFLDCSKSLKL